MPALTPDRWQQLTPYLNRALSLAGADRAAWLEEIRSDNSELAGQIEELLREHTAANREGFLQENLAPPMTPSLAGQAVGPYRLLSEIGHGGMGVVWLAERADGRFERRAAVKFLSQALAGQSVQARFKREAAILGRLSHPNIAELLDAGVSATGQPYIVLEYVDGDSITAYCDRHKLSIRARLQLFLDVIGAVAHAHANLIVHRDLKPSNVLVSADGVPKLLDFGIAKLLESSGDEPVTVLTREAASPLTPQYAAPEQITGGAITTATDVYALGVLLYEILTGQHPAGSSRSSPAELVKAIVDTDPPKLSAMVTSTTAEQCSILAANRDSDVSKLPRQLRGDLETVVAKALKKAPGERYASVVAFADDLRRYLEHQPVSARPDTLVYRAAKFARRNRAAILLTSGALAVVIASLSTGLYVANRERRIAEQRFAQVRQLANKFVALDESLRGLPGATKVRNRIVADSLQYLTSLGAEVHGDKELSLEIAKAYLSVAHAQGDPTSANLGQFDEAEVSLQKAQTFVDSVLAKEPTNQLALAMSAGIAHDHMCITDVEHHKAQTLAWAGKTADRIDRLANVKGYDSKYVYGLGYYETNVAIAYANNRRFDQAERAAERAFDIVQSNDLARHLEGSILMALEEAQWDQGQLQKALATAQRAITLQAQEAAPGHASIRLNLANSLLLEGAILGMEDAEPSLGNTSAALAAFQRGFEIAEELASKDPADNRSRLMEAQLALQIANILRHSDPHHALRMYDRALVRLRETQTNESRSQEEVELLAGSSYAARWAGQSRDAKERLNKALELLREKHKIPAEQVEPMSDVYSVLRAEADALVESGDAKKAAESYQRLLDLLMAGHPDLENDLRDATCLSRTWIALAGLQRRLGRTQEAARLEEQRAALWKHWKDKLPDSDVLLRQSAKQITRHPPSPHFRFHP